VTVHIASHSSQRSDVRLEVDLNPKP